MAGLRAERPPEFKSEVQWYKFFSTKSFITLLVSSVVAFGILKLFLWIHLGMVGVLIGLMLVVLSVSVVVIPVPEGNILHGSGMTLDVVIFHVLVRKKKRRIYIKFV